MAKVMWPDAGSIDQSSRGTRLLWIGQERTMESFDRFFTLIGEGLAKQIQFVCSDMWKPYLNVIAERCSQAIHILDRFHIVAKMNVLNDVRSAEYTPAGPGRLRTYLEKVPVGVC